MVALANFNPIWFVRSVPLLFAYLLLWLALQDHAISKPRELRVPPVGETTTVRVMRGGYVEVTLKAAEGRANPLSYELVSLPQHGRLGDLRQADTDRQTSASIVYTHGDDEDSTSDEFTFRARSLVGGGVSSPIKVKLQIVDAPPQLQITPLADFSAVAGESDLQQIILANEGGGLIEGRVAPKEPFHVEGEDRFSLGRGAMTNILIRFSPKKAESVAPQKLAPAPADPGATVTLRGEVSAPFQASAEPLKVEDAGSRSGTIVVSNLASVPLAVDIELIPKEAAEAAARAEIKEHSTAKIPVEIGPEKASGAFDLRVIIASPFHQQDLIIPVPAVPPRLELVTPELDFGASSEAELAVKNTGGAEGRFSLDLPATVKSIEGAASFAVQAGSVRSVTLRHEEQPDSKSAEELIVDLGKGGRLPVALKFADARALNPEPPQPPRTWICHFEKEWQLNKDVRLVLTSEKSALIAWLASKENWTDAQLERLSPEGTLQIDGQTKVAKENFVPSSWWQRMYEAMRSVWRRLRTALGGTRLSQLDENPTTQAEDTEWKKSEVPEDDLESDSLRWRITAVHRGQNERKPVSDVFQIRAANNTLVVSFPDDNPTPPPSDAIDSFGSWVRIIGRTLDKNGLTLAVVQPWQPDVADIRVEEIIGIIGTESGPPVYETRIPPPSEARVLNEGDYLVSGGIELRATAVCFKNIPKGGGRWFRLVSQSETGQETISEPFPVEGEPKTTMPWRYVFLAAFGGLLLVLWRELRKRGGS